MSDSFPDSPQILLNDSNRPTSIDFSLELERQLEAESLPSSPNPLRPQSLDVNVLASIVTQLRESLAGTSRERDVLMEKLTEAQTREQGMRETLDHVADKCLQMENDLESATAQHKDDEETIAMLRSKVEESRRALMRLQTEKRMSQVSNLSLDLSRSPPPHLTFNGPPSSKRASFAPLTGSAAGRAHRRISSVSDASLLGEPSTWPPPSPRSPLIPEDPEATPVERPNKRMSLLFGRGPSPQPEPSASPFEVESLRKQCRTLQQQLDNLKRDLTESQEAHEASELCVRALRTFISDNNVGVPSTVKSAAVVAPSASSPSHSKQPSTASRWGFKLWTTTAEAGASKPNTPSSTPVAPLPPADIGAIPSPSQPMPRKFGGFFGGRTTSVSSSGSTRPSEEHVPQEPLSNGSDTSSLDESTGPISPTSESRAHVVLPTNDKAVDGVMEGQEVSVPGVTV
ncbi:uncharacterized protein BXZ73DRAFT_76686 [Epithele typhae]|uniref:uncharacterized protein n=1 Tax=Epithele typhae TaxID=378194 RepID=UPI0020087592|nr:uncharacterized protein BXZ73DRAFT_76686 [Epithele typhae]KAH9935855.1 hypothetical protein BXZ73DRAFT_76686 [Epithele typhae]